MMLDQILNETVCVESGGNGPASLMFLHGGGSGKCDWASQMRYLDGMYRVVALDIPGHGASSIPAVASIEYLAEIGREVQRRHGLARTILIGHSMGSWVALEMYRQNPSGIAGIVLIECSRLAESLARRDALRKQVRKSGAKALLLQSHPGVFMPGTDPDLIAFHLRRVEALCERYVEELILNTVDWDVTLMAPTLRNVRVPLLILQSTAVDGELRRRPLARVDQSSWISFARTNAPHAEVKIIANAGHFPHIDQPSAVSVALEHFAHRALSAAPAIAG
jgi:pimeloyl-ACP methyl ester carboxylesterase